MRNSLIKLGFLIFLITLGASILLLPTPNTWIPTVISQNQQALQIQDTPTPLILKTNTTQYVIIAPPEWANNAHLTQFAEWKTQKGIPTTIFNTTHIYENYPGNDNQSKIRNFLIDAYNQWNIRWVLLTGNTTIIPIRYFWTGLYNVPSDYYYAALNGTFDDNGNGLYGEFGEIDWTPELYVGRLPASNHTELETMINKTLTYEIEIANYIGEWMKTAVFAGGQLSRSSDIQGWRIKNYIRDYIFPKELNMKFTNLFYDSIRSYTNLTLDNFTNAINNGCTIVNLCSHGSSTSVSVSESGGSYYNSNFAASSNNGYKLPIVFASACSTASLDDAGDCLGEAMVKNPNGGAVSYIGSTRTSYGGDNINDLSDSLLDALFFEILLHTDDGLFSQRAGYALYESKQEYYQKVGLFRMAENSIYRQELFEYILLGDPELPIWTNTPQNLCIILPGYTPTPGQIMQIRIQDNEGRPVSNALICIQGTEYYHTYLTDSQGRIKIPAPITGQYNITVTKPNHLYNTTTLEVGSTPDQPTNFNINAPTSISPGEQFTINISCSDPQGIISLEIVVTDYNKLIVNSTPMLGHSHSFTIDSSYFNNNSIVFYARAIDSQGYQTISDAQKVYVQSPKLNPTVLVFGSIPSGNSQYLQIFLSLIPFLIFLTLVIFAWSSKEEQPSNPTQKI
ncbi:MAG: C25 family cysteine peptidase [Candidatus Freyarchaeota archaeon]